VPADWPGKYRVEDDPEGDWDYCQMIDISVIGVGLELFGPVPEDIIGRRLAVEVGTPVGASVSIHLAGEVKNTAAGAEGGTRVGMEFVDLSETERKILQVMELLQVVW
jgi:hypothetical protein